MAKKQKQIIEKSKKHQKASTKVNKDQAYPLDEAISIVKNASYSKFDGTVEVHFNLDIDVKQADQTIRTTTSLPHGTGKEVKVAAFSLGEVKGADLSLAEQDIEMISQGKLVPGKDFDMVVAEPSMMPKLAKVAKVLGPKGMMPNPKTGTVSDNLEDVVAKIKKGSVELRNEANAPIVHTKIGKVSFDDANLKENFKEVYKTMKSHRPQKAPLNWIKSCYLTATMGPSVKVEISTL